MDKSRLVAAAVLLALLSGGAEGALVTRIVPAREAGSPASESGASDASLDLLETLVFSSSSPCDRAAPAVDALEGAVAEAEARYWAYLMRRPDFASRSLTRLPGSEIANPVIKAYFDARLRFWYGRREASAPPLETIRTVNDVAQKIDMLEAVCGKTDS